jgi:hypothetical protein
MIPPGLTIGVRCRKVQGWDFALNGIEFGEFKADIGLLVWKVDNERAEIGGWTTKSHFAAYCQVRDYGHGKRLILYPRQMLSPASLMNIRDRWS